MTIHTACTQVVLLSQIPSNCLKIASLSLRDFHAISFSFLLGDFFLDLAKAILLYASHTSLSASPNLFLISCLAISSLPLLTSLFNCVRLCWETAFNSSWHLLSSVRISSGPASKSSSPGSRIPCSSSSFLSLFSKLSPFDTLSDWIKLFLVPQSSSFPPATIMSSTWVIRFSSIRPCTNLWVNSPNGEVSLLSIFSFFQHFCYIFLDILIFITTFCLFSLQVLFCPSDCKVLTQRRHSVVLRHVTIPFNQILKEFYIILLNWSTIWLNKSPKPIRSLILWSDRLISFC